MIRTANEMTTEVREKMRGGPGSVRFAHLFKPEEFGAPVRLCARLTLAPGSGIGEHEHVAEDEVYVILQGEGMLSEGVGPRKVVAGDAVLTGRGGRHSIVNTGRDELQILAFIATYPK
jgi:mannose-6-phosphate isomerase-like protein (cupin superfamily)